MNITMPIRKKITFGIDTPTSGGSVPLSESAIPPRKSPQYTAKNTRLSPKPMDFSLRCAFMPSGKA